MADAVKTLSLLKRADKLARINMHEYGPHSYRRGMGKLIRTLEEKDGATQREIVEATGWSRNYLKNVVKKAEKRGLVSIIECAEPRTYGIKLTDAGKEVLTKRNNAQTEAAEKILSALTPEEQEQLDTLLEKVLLSAKAEGKICAYGKGRKLHKGHRGHIPHAAFAE